MGNITKNMGNIGKTYEKIVTFLTSEKYITKNRALRIFTVRSTVRRENQKAVALRNFDVSPYGNLNPYYKRSLSAIGVQ